MRSTTTLLIVALVSALLLSVLPAGAAEADYELEKGDSVTHQGDQVPGGANPLYFEQAPGVGGHETCSTDPDTYCETLLVKVTNPVEDTDPDVIETAFASIGVILSTDAADYDLIVSSSDEEGTRGPEIGRSTAFPAGDTSETVFGAITTSETQPSKYVLIDVVYFAPTTPMSLRISFG